MPDRDPSCPLCAKPNDCAMANSRAVTSCWCIQTPIPQPVLARVPATKVNSACVCKQCATAPA
jgi:Cysteine-rich CWC